ncbi:TRAP transporter small permease [Saccharospirillum salsuginis]|nr:TRAP transporter small permease [Saccharospirillum salsuginis]
MTALSEPKTGLYDGVMRLFSRINFALACIAAVVLLCATSFVFLEILSRFFLGKSQIWVIEISSYSLLYMTFLGAPYMLEKQRHVAIDLLTDALGEPWRSRLAFVMSLLAALICGVLTWYGTAVAWDQFQFGTREASLLAPKSYWLTIVFPIGMGLMTVQFIDQAIKSLRG